MKLNPVLAQLGNYPLAEIQDLARGMRERGEPLVDFSIGDPREPTPPFIPEALRAAVPVVSQYPTAAGLPQVRQAIASYLRRRFGVSVDPATQVIPTSGSKEAIFTTPLAFVDGKGDQAVVFGTPGYPVFDRGSRFAGAEAVGSALAVRASPAANPAAVRKTSRRGMRCGMVVAPLPQNTLELLGRAFLAPARFRTVFDQGASYGRTKSGPYLRRAYHR